MNGVADKDSPWKEAWRIFLRSMLRVCFPELERGINWRREPQFLDKELQQIFRGAARGRHVVDLLIKVWLIDGSEKWILIHVEVQNTRERDFPERLFRCNYRAQDAYDRPVITLAVLTDADPSWRPSFYEQNLPGTRVRFDFSVCKLLDLDEEQLRASKEPAAIVVLAHLAAQKAKRDDERRFNLKRDLIRRLYEAGYGREEIEQLFRLLDWLIRLPEAMETRLWEQVCELESEKAMPYVTSVERIGIKKGRQEGLKQGRQEGRQEGLQQGVERGQLMASRQNILDLIEVRFGTVPESIRERVNAEGDLAKLRQWLRQVAICPSLADLHLA